jgi:predicted DNA-binding protein (MmcQ/YjbR family)
MMTPKQVEAAALALPGAVVTYPWGDDHPVYKVGGKMFAAMGGGKAPSLSFKVGDVAFEMLIEREGIVPAPYLARAKWVQLTTLKVMDDAEIRERLAEAHRLVVEKLPKKLRPQIRPQIRPPM